MPASEDNGPYRLEGGATYDRIAQLETELAALRANSQPQLRALAELRMRHLREDESELIERFKVARGRLHLATAGMMIATFAALLLGLWHAPLGAMARIACGVAVTLVAAVGTGSQSLMRRHVRERYRRLQRRIDEERVLAGLEPSAHREGQLADPFDIRDHTNPLADLTSTSR